VERKYGRLRAAAASLAGGALSHNAWEEHMDRKNGRWGSLGVTLLAFVALLAGPSATLGADFNFRFASYAPEGDVIDRALQKFKEELETRSGGRIELTVFRNNTLGSNREALELAKVGAVDFVVSGSSHVSRFAPIFGAVSFPFLWKDRQVMFKVLDGPIGERLNKAAETEAQGLKFLTWFDTGFRHVSNNLRPVLKPEDVQGLKLRTLPTQVQVAFWRKLGAIPTPMDWAEVMPALQQGVIDGQENAPSVMYPYKVYEVQKYYSLTGHSNEPTLIVMSKATFDRLPVDLQTVVTDSIKAVTPYERDIAEEYNVGIMAELGKVIAINEVPEETKEHFRKVGAEIYAEGYASIGPEGEAIVKEIVETTH
jgi:tripartite ATP-independent transporter DctP family solute receptor